MSFRSQTEALIKVAIGATGTAFSIVLENISIIISIIAGLGTALYMFQAWKNARAEGKAFEEDRQNNV